MNQGQVGQGFTAFHHAMLFAWLAREAIDIAGEEKAGPAIREAVRRYGEQRGRRMALRARANGHDLSMLNYLAYNEWKAGRGEAETRIADKRPHMRVVIPKCCWFTAWTENDLVRYGRYYCDEVDAALARGFNPELLLEVRRTKPAGHPECEMVFHGMDLGPSTFATYLFRKLVRPGKKALMPWDYHTGHLYKTFSETVNARLGSMGHRACEKALAVFAERYGHGEAQIVKEYLETDFGRVP